MFDHQEKLPQKPSQIANLTKLEKGEKIVINVPERGTLVITGGDTSFELAFRESLQPGILHLREVRGHGELKTPYSNQQLVVSRLQPTVVLGRNSSLAPQENADATLSRILCIVDFFPSQDKSDGSLHPGNVVIECVGRDGVLFEVKNPEPAPLRAPVVIKTLEEVQNEIRTLLTDSPIKQDILNGAVYDQTNPNLLFKSAKNKVAESINVADRAALETLGIPSSTEDLGKLVVAWPIAMSKVRLLDGSEWSILIYENGRMEYTK